MKRRELKAWRYQQGISKFGLLMLVLVIAGFFTVGLKVAPLYIDHNVLTGVGRELVESGNANDMTVQEIRERFSNQLRLNNITGFDVSSIRVSRADGGTVIRIAYERRVPLFANLEIIAVFDDTIP
ncbi:MAG: hypothetical protein RLZZ385_1360 [Pseudomonadota bacterium]|jgi:hypothetical protein